MSDRTIMQLYRGPKSKIDNRVLEDGAIYFTTDTKQIYLDCDFTDSEGTTFEDRYAFGGSSGIFYGNKEFDASEINFFFTLNDFIANTTEDLPKANDLIVNKDGTFFRVLDIDVNEDGIKYARCTKLLVAGGGSGGAIGGGSVVKASRKRNSSLVLTDEGTAEIAYVVRDLEDPEAIIGMNFYIEGRLIDTFSEIETSVDDNDIKTFDITPYERYFRQNDTTIVAINFTDANGNVVTSLLTYTVRKIKLSIIKTQEFGIIKSDNFTYECQVNFDESASVKPKTKYNYEVIYTKYDQKIIGESLSLVTLSSGDTVRPTITYPGMDGVFEIRSWLTTELTIGSSVVTVQSNILTQTFIFQKNMDNPTLDVTFPKGSFEQYSLDAYVEYQIGYKNSTIPFRRTITVIDENGNSEIIFKDEGNEPTEIRKRWRLDLYNVGTYKVTLELLSGKTVMTSASGTFTVTAFTGAGSTSVPIISTGTLSGLKLDLRAKGKTNSANDYNQWISTIEGSEVKTVCNLVEGFNWITNGWQVQQDGSCLHLDNGAKLTVPYSVFSGAQEAQATVTGRTIELDVKVSNVRNRFAHWFKCASEKINSETGETETIYTGIYGNGEAVCLNSNDAQPIKTLDTKGARISEKESGYVALFEQGKRVHLTFVITPAGRTVGANIPSNMVYVYINGVISGLADYGTSKFNQNTPTSYMYFDSSDVDIDIYNIRVYDAVLGHRSVLQNYLASQEDMQVSISRWKDNGVAIYDEDQPEKGYHISLSAVKAAKNIPYMVFRGGVPCNKKGQVDMDKINIASLPGDGQATESDPESLKEDFRLMDVYYVDPKDSKNNIASQDHRTQMVVYPQGTSSMGYPVKNLRIKMIEGEYKNGYKLYDNLPPVNLFCLKADYMESSSSNNTGTGNILNALYGTLKTPAQAKDPNCVTAIMGRPIVCFYKPFKYEDQYKYKGPDGTIIDYPENQDDDRDYVYIGRYNFNLDKKTPEPFGFKSDIDAHFGVNLDYGADKTIMNLVKDENFIEKLQSLSVKAGFQATTDETYDPSKHYYFEPKEGSQEWVSKVWATIVDPENMSDKEEEALEKEFCAQLEKGPLYTYHDSTEGTNSIQCWEFLTNTHALTRLQAIWNEEEDKVREIEEEDETTHEMVKKTKYYYDWNNAFESRYPEYATKSASDKRAFSALVNWIASTNQAKVLNEPNEAERLTNPNKLTPLFPSDENPDLPARDENGELRGIGEYYYDSKEYRLYKFANEFDDHMHRDFTLFYYILTELLIMMDSRAKNMMMCCFDADNDAGTGIWFPIFYDMDTACGLDNTGRLIYRYDEEDYFRGVYNAAAGYKAEDGEPNDSYGTLWCNIREAVNKNLNNFKSSMNNLYLRLRGNALTEDNLIKYYNTEQANAWNETYINYDEEYKYIIPYDGGSETAKLFAAQGTRSEYRSQLLKKRLQYIDSKRMYGPWSINLTDGRANKYSDKGNLDFTFTAADSTYIGYGFTNGQFEGPFMIREGDSFNFGKRDFSVNMETGTEEQEIYLNFLNNLSDLGDLSYKYISAFKLDVSDKEGGHYSKVHTLKFGRHGDPDFATHFDNKIKMLTGLSVKYFPMLETLDIAYLPGLTGSAIDLRNNKYLKKLYAEGTKLTTLQLPEGGVLEEVYAPKTLSNLSIINHGQLKNLFIDDTDAQYPAWKKIDEMNIAGCYSLDSLNIFNQVNPHIKVSLPDLDWSLDDNYYELDEVTGTMITTIPVMQKLIECHGIDGTPACRIDNNQQWNYNDLITNRSYVGGKIYIQNRKFTLNDDDEKIYEDEGYGIDEVELYEKYGIYYPNLKFEYEPSIHNVTGYSLYAYNVAGELIQGYPRKFKNTEINIKFNFNDCFTPEGAYYLKPQDNRGDTTEYEYSFVGWNTTGLITLEERTYDLGSIEANIAKMKEDALARVIIAYDAETKTYNIANNFDMENIYSEQNKELHLYPTYIATVKSYEVKFDDGLGNGEESIYDVQFVRAGEIADDPSYKPTKVRLPDASENLENSKLGFVSPFKNYGAETLGPISGPKTFIANYYEEVPIQEVPSPEGYFEGVWDNGRYILKVLKHVNAEAITIPLIYKENTVHGFKVDIDDSGNTKKIRRIFVEKRNNLESEITHIEAKACQNFTKLEYIDLENMPKLQVINDNAFQECQNLYLTKLPDSVMTIGGSAFNGCVKVQLEHLPRNVQTIGPSAFARSGLSNCNLAHATSLIEIGANAFQSCKQLQALEGLPASIKIIGNQAFGYCSNLAFVLSADKYPNLMSIGESAFNGTSISLESLPERLEKIYNLAFANAKGIATFESIPSSVTLIGTSAFMGLTWADVEGGRTLTLLNPAFEVNDSTGYFTRALNGIANGVTRLRVVNNAMSTLLKNTNALGSNITDIDVE